MPALASETDQLCINVVRGLAMDAVQQAKSGHPGLPMGAAAIAHTLFTRHLKHSPRHPDWFDRDRFILSAGHGSMLLYALLHLTGYDLSLEEIEEFRQWGSKTPGHPENHLTPGVEMATGPLGQGIATAVGMALAERSLAATFNRPGVRLVDHFTYVLASDGDLMEGISHEACSLAGHQGLGKLIVLYDDNGITIDGKTDLSFSESVEKRFEAYGWHIRSCDGMDVSQVDDAISRAKEATDRPSIVCCRTIIGYGSPNKEGTSKCHGAPLGPEEVALAKQRLGLPEEPFWVPQEVLDEYRKAVVAGEERVADWEACKRRQAHEDPSGAALFESATGGTGPVDWTKRLESLDADKATREHSNDVINAIAAEWPLFVSGCADLAESVKTDIKSGGHMSADHPKGRNVSYGVREHAMAAAVNGMNLHGGLRAFGGSFLVFSDYCRPAIRLAALMEVPSVFAFSHDSIGLGEDGPTHQPIEHLASLRAMPNLNVMRPADGGETAASWRLALSFTKTPTLIVLSRQKLPSVTPSVLKNHPAERGAYVVREASGRDPKCVLIGTGSELSIAIAAGEILEAKGVPTRVVSMPSWFVFEKQAQSYKDEVLPSVPTVSVEAGATFGWSKYAQAHIGLDHFGASAPAEVLYEKFGITAEAVVQETLKLISC